MIKRSWFVYMNTYILTLLCTFDSNYPTITAYVYVAGVDSIHYSFVKIAYIINTEFKLISEYLQYFEVGFCLFQEYINIY
jgi:hypothetical protein